ASASRTVTARNDRLVTLRIAVTRAPAAPRGNALLAFTVGAVRVGALAEHRRPGRAALDPRGPATPDGAAATPDGAAATPGSAGNVFRGPFVRATDFL